MRLSEAILLGRNTIEHLVAKDPTSCAMPMALNAIGGKACTHGFTCPCGYNAIRTAWPWLVNAAAIKCPWCGYLAASTGLIWHPFDQHVMKGEITLEQMCDWLRTIEPPEPEPVHSGSLIEDLIGAVERTEAKVRTR